MSTARLPIPGEDKGTWGDILNQYLSVSFASDGTVNSGVIGSAQLAANSVTANALAVNVVTGANIATGSITEAELSGSIQASLANADAAVAGTAPDASTTTKGLIQLSGALTGTSSAPTIAAGAISDVNISSSAAISQTKVNGLSASLGAKADISSLATIATSGSYADLINKPALPTIPVTSVAGRTGDVTLTSIDVGLANVTNTSDANKPISTATQTALNLKATTSSLATVATSGSYADLVNKPAIPSVNMATTSAQGIIQLAGDLGGSGTSASAPTLAATSNVTSIVNTIIGANATAVGAVQKANNLSDLPSATLARTNLGLGAGATAQLDVGGGIPSLDGNAKLSSLELPDSVQAIILEVSGVYPLRTTVTASTTRPVIWRGADAPTIGSGYAINDMDTWEPLT